MSSLSRRLLKCQMNARIRSQHLASIDGLLDPLYNKHPRSNHLPTVKLNARAAGLFADLHGALGANLMINRWWYPKPER